MREILSILSQDVMLACFSMSEISSIYIILSLHLRNDISSLKLWK